MRRAYIVVGLDPETDKLEQMFGACHTMNRAEEMCLEAETKNPELIFCWYEVVEEDD